ncbi:unnamed protein product [Blepharisma stoltei]|uniref:HMG box domain-containing protein n=1 Tax=Blepharisma stoltei TaxID=1481888 RepID=A0AAU9IM01_9CILI|nr:unnamed protein product [Blepharisma stoltei]
MPKKGNSEGSMKSTKDKAQKQVTKKKAEPESDQEEEKPVKHDGIQPKRARSAYIFFSTEKRPEISEEYKGKEAMKKLGAMWKECSDAAKKPYIALAEKDKERFDRQMAEFEKTGEFHDEDGNVVTEDKPMKRRSMSAKESAGTKRKAGGKKKC